MPLFFNLFNNINIVICYFLKFIKKLLLSKQLAHINWQIVNETALQCVADKPSTVDGTTSEMVGLSSRQILNSWLLQTRLRELRPDED